MTEYEALLCAVEVLDGQVGMAAELSKRMNLNIKQQHVHNWIHRGKRLPERYAMTVEAATKAKGRMVSAKDLCPIAFAESA